MKQIEAEEIENEKKKLREIVKRKLEVEQISEKLENVNFVSESPLKVPPQAVSRKVIKNNSKSNVVSA
jgi:hypothetical protein